MNKPLELIPIPKKSKAEVEEDKLAAAEAAEARLDEIDQEDLITPESTTQSPRAYYLDIIGDTALISLASLGKIKDRVLQESAVNMLARHSYADYLASQKNEQPRLTLAKFQKENRDEFVSLIKPLVEDYKRIVNLPEDQTEGLSDVELDIWEKSQELKEKFGIADFEFVSDVERARQRLGELTKEEPEVETEKPTEESEEEGEEEDHLAFEASEFEIPEKARLGITGRLSSLEELMILSDQGAEGLAYADKKIAKGVKAAQEFVDQFDASKTRVSDREAAIRQYQKEKGTYLSPEVEDALVRFVDLGIQHAQIEALREKIKSKKDIRKEDLGSVISISFTPREAVRGEEGQDAKLEDMMDGLTVKNAEIQRERASIVDKFLS